MAPRELCFDRVSLRLGGRPVLADVTLRCAAGEACCLVGPNGAGKSTILALAAALLPASAGRILLGGRAIRPFVPSAEVTYLPQASAFPPLLTAREAVDFACRLRRVDVRARDEVLAVTGVDAVSDRRIGELSGGWVRRLGLAVALAGPASVLLLDEPFTGLDPETLDRLVGELARRMAAGATVLLASHDFDVVDATAHRLAVLDDGVLRGVFPVRGGSRLLYRQVLGGAARAGGRRVG